MKKKIDWKKTILKLIISILILGLIIVGFYLLFRYLGWTSLTKEQLQEKISSFGIWAPLVFILASFLQVTFIPIPSTVTIIAGSFLFGPFLSFIYSYIGIVLGSILAFYLGRLIGKPFVNWVIGDEKVVDDYLLKMKNKENIILFFMFLFPFFPDDALCSLAGILPMSFLAFLFMQLTTRLTSIGATLLFMSGEIIPYQGWGLVVIIFVCLLGLAAFVISLKYAEKINELFYRLVEKITSKNKKR